MELFVCSSVGSIWPRNQRRRASRSLQNFHHHFPRISLAFPRPHPVLVWQSNFAWQQISDSAEGGACNCQDKHCVKWAPTQTSGSYAAKIVAKTAVCAGVRVCQCAAASVCALAYLPWLSEPLRLTLTDFSAASLAPCLCYILCFRYSSFRIYCF